MIESCANCKYSNALSHWNYECRKNAPIVVHDPNKNAGVYPEAFVARFPFMGASDWCGDFEKSIKYRVH